MRALGIAATGMRAQELNVSVISNNIANMSTTGYKRQRAEFQDLLYQTQRSAGINSADEGTIVPTGIQLGLGVKNGAVYRVHQQGVLTQTDSRFDLAVSGKGFFQVNKPDGTNAYTRAGAFQINQDGEIVSTEGFTVSPGITIPQDAESVDISEEGEVFVKIASDPTPQNVGQIDLVNFINEAGLEAKGNNLYLETEASGTPIVGVAGDEGFGKIQQGFLELSNVDSVIEITTLISAQRAYELNSRVISTGDEMLQSLSQLR